MGKSEEQHKKTEKALSISEEKFRGFLEAAPDAIMIVDREGSILLVNAETEKMFGYNRNELLGQNMDLLIPARLRKLHEKYVAEYFSRPRKRPMGTDLNLVACRKDGQEFIADIKLSPFANEAEIVVICIIRDLTRILSGLLPICASCKKIRDDQGYWNQIESYITDHSEAVFSHSICPDCKKKLYYNLEA